MDNNAFRTLINERQLASQKSTKEIAREAVENEFRQKKQSRGGGGKRRSSTDYYDSDSDNDNQDDELMKRRRRQGEEVNDDEPEWKKRRRIERGASSSSGYRDRAKERREGKNLDYNLVSSSAVLQNEDDKRRQAELSKFLGGDEEHTHLVKGLDKALAEKVRREEMGGGRQQEEDLDELLESAIVAKEKSNSKTSTIERIEPKSDLGKSVLKYLQQQQRGKEPNSIMQQQSIQRNTAKQNSIHRSQYTFSLDANIQKRHAAWDAPQLKMIGASSSLGERGSMTPLNGHLIATIKKKLDGTIVTKKKDIMTSNDVVDSVKTNGNDWKQQQSSVTLKGEADDKEVTQNDTNEKTATLSTLINKEEDKIDDESDDDIFGDVGVYVPPTAKVIASTAATDSETNNDASKTTTTDPSAAKKQTSIFDNLLADQKSNKLNRSQTHQSMQLQNPQHQQAQLNNSNKAVIDRDVFGGSRKQDEQQQQNNTRRRGPQTAAMEGVSMTNYSGGYGEEMDTDFLNEEEDVYRKFKRKEAEDGEDAVDVDDNDEDD